MIEDNETQKRKKENDEINHANPSIEDRIRKLEEHIDDMSYCIQQINIQQQLIQQLQTKNIQLEKDLIDIKKAIEDAKT